VWEKFYRAQRVVELNLARGTGIGLAVVKALVEAQGGSVGLHSVPSKGACFWFEVPVTEPESLAGARGDAGHAAGAVAQGGAFPSDAPRLGGSDLLPQGILRSSSPFPPAPSPSG
jgi:hypothetical protein